ncbi:MAG: MBL fold metallo-hydrolase [Chlamydiales bacterium]|nr:MBL fold metallo-hydrolase [Chlamydiales bacterium]
MEKRACPKLSKRRGRRPCYYNPHCPDSKRTLLDVFLWKVGYYDAPVKEPRAPEGFSYPIPNAPLDPSAPTVTWINHSTFLIRINGLNILTDPIWSERCSPISFLGPKRKHLPPIEIAALPQIDLVLISHDHYDHLDKRTVRALARRFPKIIWLVPKGVKRWFDKQKIASVCECSWWEDLELAFPKLHLKATAVPAQHYSGRSARDLNTTLWAGWIVEFRRESELPKSLYFVGDTGYNPHDFKQIGKLWPQIDLSLIPIGAYQPRKFMSPVHIGPKEAVLIHKEVSAKLSIGMHWKTFPSLSDEGASQPPFDLLNAMREERLNPATFLALEPGHEINW